MSGVLNFAISSAVESTNAPPIPKAQGWGREYSATSQEFGQLLDLSQGVPKNAPHHLVLEELKKSSSDPLSAKYGNILGELKLRENFAEEIRFQYNLKAPQDSSTLTNSTKNHNNINNQNIESSLNDDTNSTKNVEKSTYGSINNNDNSLSSNNNQEDNLQEGTITYEDIGITTGCNMAFLVLMMSICNSNSSTTTQKDGVMIPLPSYFNQMMVFSLLNLKPIYIPCNTMNNFKPDINSARTYLENQLKDDDTITTKIKVICLVTPNNPTGSVYSNEELKEWYDLAKRFKIALVLDETYRDFVEGKDDNDNDGKRGIPHSLFKEKDWRATFISLGSFSKGYRIPGHRLGSIIASPTLLKHITTICDCMQICAPRPPQIAISHILPQLREDLDESSRALSKRRKLFTEIVNKVKGWNVISIGGYFAYVSYPKEFKNGSSNLGLKRKLLGSEEISKIMATKFGVVTLPGSFFMPDLNDDEVWENDILPRSSIDGKDDGDVDLRDDIWLRFAVANVDDEVIIKLGPRLLEMNKMMGIEDD